MPAQEKLIAADGVVTDCLAARLRYVVEQEHVVPVRQYAHYLFPVHAHDLLMRNSSAP